MNNQSGIIKRGGKGHWEPNDPLSKESDLQEGERKPCCAGRSHSGCTVPPFQVAWGRWDIGGPSSLGRNRGGGHETWFVDEHLGGSKGSVVRDHLSLGSKWGRVTLAPRLENAS